MATILERPTQKSDGNTGPDKFDIFADALTQLCREHGIGVEGAVAYEATPEDLEYRYRCEDSGDLIRVH